MKAGFAGDEQPKCILPSLLGKTKYRQVMAGALEGHEFVGNRAQELRGLLKLRYPIEHGVIHDWEGMERLWNHLYSEELKVSPEFVSEPFSYDFCLMIYRIVSIFMNSFYSKQFF